MQEHPVDSPLRVIGRYALYGALAAGGMATVHFGRLLGPAGFSRTVAIKRLHPQYAKDPEFVAMFLDEARLAARIQHPNVVATLDVVALQEELFLVMDYIRGESFSRLLRTSRKRGVPVSLRIISSAIAGLLHGLHAAHEAKDERGQPLSIVHRDVSPQNVLVGVDGIARVLDFGVAKAAARIQVTRDGQMKGKLSYMAPEQLKARGVDRRTDVFAAGIVFWEALTGRRLFDGELATEVLDMILKDEVPPPSAFAPHLPPEVDALVLKALEKEPDNRYQSAREFAIAIEETVSLASLREVGEWVEAVAGDTLSRREQTLAEIESVSDGADLGSDSSPGFLKTLDGHVRAPAFVRQLRASSKPAAAPATDWDEAPTNIFDPARFGTPSRDATTGVHVPHPSPAAPSSTPRVPPRPSEPRHGIGEASKAPPVPRRNSGPASRRSPPAPSSPSSAGAIPSSRRQGAGSAIPPISGRTQVSMPPLLPKRRTSPSQASAVPVSSHRVVAIGSPPRPTPAAASTTPSTDFGDEQTTVYDEASRRLASTSSPAQEVPVPVGTGAIYEPPAAPPAQGGTESNEAEHPPTVIVNDPGPAQTSKAAAEPFAPAASASGDEPSKKQNADIAPVAAHRAEGGVRIRRAGSDGAAFNVTQPGRKRVSAFFNAFDKTQPMLRARPASAPKPRAPVLLYVIGLLLAVGSFAVTFVLSRQRLMTLRREPPVLVAPQPPIERVALEKPPDPPPEPQAVDPSALPPAGPDVESRESGATAVEPSAKPPESPAPRVARRWSKPRRVDQPSATRASEQTSRDTPAAKVTLEETSTHEQELLADPYAASKASAQTGSNTSTKAVRCAQPYEIDQNGIRRIKPECL